MRFMAVGDLLFPCCDVIVVARAFDSLVSPRAFDLSSLSSTFHHAIRSLFLSFHWRLFQEGERFIDVWK